MPYIKDEEREPLDHIVKLMGEWVPGDKPGRLTYTLYAFFVRHWPRNFFSFCLFFGAVALTLLEVWRRIIWMYENGKIRENGDVH